VGGVDAGADAVSADGTVQDIFIYGLILLGVIACVSLGWAVSNARASKGLPPMNKQELEADREKWVEDFYKQQAEIERLTSELTEARAGRWPQIVTVLNGQLAEIERLRAELAAAPRVMIHEHWNAPALDQPAASEVAAAPP
jgi:hypothetical protein